jgi:Coenzyme PQQ synthesis protein D (PqqD)
MKDSLAIYRRAPEVVAATMGEISLLLHVNNWVYLELNESGSRIWELLEGGQAIPQLVSTLIEEFAVAPEDCAEETADFLSLLESKNFVVRS